MTTTTLIVTVVLSAIVAIGIDLIWLKQIVELERTTAKQEAEIARLEAENNHLREMQGKRIPYDLRKTIENAVFAVGRFEIELDENRAMLDNAKAHLMKLTKE